MAADQFLDDQRQRTAALEQFLDQHIQLIRDSRQPVDDAPHTDQSSEL